MAARGGMSRGGGAHWVPREARGGNRLKARFLLTNQVHASIIIGRGGSNVKQIRQECNVFVSILQSAEGPSSPGVRVMKIDGAPDCVANAIEKIALILNSQSPEAKHRGRPTGFSDEVHEPIRLLVHDGLLAFFYDEVANLQDKSECKVVIEPEPLPNSSEKLVVFNGSPAAIRDVAEKWFKLMLSLCTQHYQECVATLCPFEQAAPLEQAPSGDSDSSSSSFSVPPPSSMPPPFSSFSIPPPSSAAPSFFSASSPPVSSMGPGRGWEWSNLSSSVPLPVPDPSGTGGGHGHLAAASGGPGPSSAGSTRGFGGSSPFLHSSPGPAPAHEFDTARTKDRSPVRAHQDDDPSTHRDARSETYKFPPREDRRGNRRDYRREDGPENRRRDERWEEDRRDEDRRCEDWRGERDRRSRNRGNWDRRESSLNRASRSPVGRARAETTTSGVYQTTHCRPPLSASRVDTHPLSASRVDTHPLSAARVDQRHSSAARVLGGHGASFEPPEQELDPSAYYDPLPAPPDEKKASADPKWSTPDPKLDPVARQDVALPSSHVRSVTEANGSIDRRIYFKSGCEFDIFTGPPGEHIISIVGPLSRLGVAVDLIRQSLGSATRA